MNNKLDNGRSVVKTGGKEWPKDNEIAKFGDIADPVVEALKIAIKKGDKVYNEGIEWTGFTQGSFTAATVPDPSFALHAKNLTYSKKEQGRDVFTEIISIAVQLGIEQGRRMVADKLKEYEFMLDQPDFAKEMIKGLIEG